MSTGDKEYGKIGERMKGAAHVVHGLGENIRGTMMGAADSISGTEASKAKNEEIVAQGRAEMERGMAQMKGETVPTTAGEGAQPGGQPEKQAEGETKPGEGPPPQGAAQESVGPEGVQGQRTEPEAAQQVPGAAQSTIGKETQEAKSSESGKEGLIGEGADAPQGPGSSV